MTVVRIRNAADDGWIQVGGGVEVAQQATEPTSTFPGQLWLDTSAATVWPGRVFVDQYVADGTDSQWSLTFDTTYSTYQLVIEQLVPGTDADTHFIQVSTTTGWCVGAADYANLYHYASSGGGNADANAAGSSWILYNAIGAGVAYEPGMSLVMTLFNINDATYYLTAIAQGYLYTSTPLIFMFNHSLTMVQLNPLTDIRGRMSSGLIAHGKVTLYGLTDGSS